MNIYWISWYEPGTDHRPLSFPPNKAVLGWWCTGESGNRATICALVRAESEDAAKAAVREDWAADVWRFCDLRPKINLGDRFPLEDWMRPRFKAAGVSL